MKTNLDILENFGDVKTLVVRCNAKFTINREQKHVIFHVKPEHAKIAHEILRYYLIDEEEKRKIYK